MPATDPDTQQALADALQAVLRPLAELVIAQGLPFAVVQETLKRTLVDAARDGQPDPTARRMVSRISNATGLSRREVTRLCEGTPRGDVRPRSLASELFAHWTTARPYRHRDGSPRVLPRTGAAPSFEALARSLTRDVHPRSLLDEMLRLGLVLHDPDRDTVALQRSAFVPAGDVARMLGFLSDNVGDHLKAAVHNVLSDGQTHFEQAVFADELSEESIQAAGVLVREQWQALIDATVPRLREMLADDEAQDRPRPWRVRIGLYSFNEATASPTPARTSKAGRPARKTKE